MEKKIKHLEFIQGVITRMNTNSFLVKGWLITIVSAILVFVVNKEASSNVCLVFLPSIVCFWTLDGFFFATERNYRELYKKVVSTDEDKIDFNMDASSYGNDFCWWCSGMLSKTFIPFYGSLIVILVMVLLLGGVSEQPQQN